MFILHKWNGKYGNAAKFVVEDDSKHKFAEFSPARPSDIAWVDKDIKNEDDYKEWEDFQQEKVEDLTKVIM